MPSSMACKTLSVAAPVPYQRAIAEMLGADLLVVFSRKHFNAQMPAAKTYEYLRTGSFFAWWTLSGDSGGIAPISFGFMWQI